MTATIYCIKDCNGKPCQFKEGHVGDCFPINPRTEWAPLPETPFSEVAPRLWIGGGLVEPDPHQFQAVLTLHDSLRPAPAPISERRWPIHDADVPNKSELASAVGWVFYHWAVEERTTAIRCQAGLNRSGLVAAMVLIANVVEPTEAINAVRRARSPYALCNPLFVDYLMSFGSLSDVL